MNKYKPLWIGLLLIWGGYFAFKTARFLTMETTSGRIQDISRQEFRIGVPKRPGDYVGSYMYLEIHFAYKHTGADTSTPYKIMVEPLSSEGFEKGEKVDIIFPNGHPELAQIYSVGEFWLTVPNAIMLVFACVLWLIIYAVAALKPWQR